MMRFCALMDTQNPPTRGCTPHRSFVSFVIHSIERERRLRADQIMPFKKPGLIVPADVDEDAAQPMTMTPMNSKFIVGMKVRAPPAVPKEAGMKEP